MLSGRIRGMEGRSIEGTDDTRGDGLSDSSLIGVFGGERCWSLGDLTSRAGAGDGDGAGRLVFSSWSLRGVDEDGLSSATGSFFGEGPGVALSPKRETLFALDRLRPGDILSSPGVAARGSLAWRIDGWGEDVAGLAVTIDPSAT